MAFYSDVTTGEVFKPSTSLSNDVRHFLNGLNGFAPKAMPATSSGTVRIQVCNTTDSALDAGIPVAFDSEKSLIGDAVPLKTFEDASKPWGVLTCSLQRKEIGDCIISGAVRVKISGDGDYAQPVDGSFICGSDGAPVLHKHAGKALINLGAGTPENYDGLFAVSYDASSNMLKINGGYISRNGAFSMVDGTQIEPLSGYICVYSALGSDGSWSTPEIKIATPDKYTYPIGHCQVSENGNVRVTSYRVPVVILLDTAVCPITAS